MSLDAEIVLGPAAGSEDSPCLNLAGMLAAFCCPMTASLPLVNPLGKLLSEHSKAGVPNPRTADQYRSAAC